jgi:transaldolase
MQWSSEHWLCSAEVPKKLDASSAAADKQEKVSFVDNEAHFRWELFNDAMAFEKLHEGIRGFAKDGDACKEMLRQKLRA